MEPGQDWKIAALTFLAYVHFFNGVDRMNSKYMELAIKEAQLALEENEVPIGAVIVKDNKIIAKAHNMKEEKQDATKHAEVIAIQKASKKIKNWRLIDCDIYVTLFPCPMCASALQQARIRNLYYALENTDSKCMEISKQIFEKNNTNQTVNYEQLICKDKSLELLQKFFQKKR